MAKKKKKAPKTAAKKFKKKTVSKTPSKKKAVRKAPPRAAKKTIAKKPKKPIKTIKKVIRKQTRPPAELTKLRMQAIEKSLRISVARGKSQKLVSAIPEEQTEEAAAGGTKFDIGVSHNAHAMATQEIPNEYGKDRAVLLVIDPRFVFTYWEVRHDTITRAAQKIGHNSKLTLRFYDITNTNDPETSSFWDVEVFDRLGNWYLKLEHPEQRLCLDIGIKGPLGEFISLARSNIMKLPSQTLARPGPIKWLVVTPSGDKVMSDVEEYTDADMALLKKILGPYFFDLLMRGRFASITGSSIEAIFYDVQAIKAGESPAGRPAWLNT